MNKPGEFSSDTSDWAAHYSDEADFPGRFLPPTDRFCTAKHQVTLQPTLTSGTFHLTVSIFTGFDRNCKSYEVKRVQVLLALRVLE